jgi:hypothetical protein
VEGEIDGGGDGHDLSCVLIRQCRPLGFDPMVIVRLVTVQRKCC